MKTGKSPVPRISQCTPRQPYLQFRAKPFPLAGVIGYRGGERGDSPGEGLPSRYRGGAEGEKRGREGRKSPGTRGGNGERRKEGRRTGRDTGGSGGRVRGGHAPVGGPAGKPGRNPSATRSRQEGPGGTGRRWMTRTGKGGRNGAGEGGDSPAPTGAKASEEENEPRGEGLGTGSRTRCIVMIAAFETTVENVEAENAATASAGPNPSGGVRSQFPGGARWTPPPSSSPGRWPSSP